MPKLLALETDIIPELVETITKPKPPKSRGSRRLGKYNLAPGLLMRLRPFIAETRRTPEYLKVTTILSCIPVERNESHRTESTNPLAAITVQILKTTKEAGSNVKVCLAR